MLSKIQEQIKKFIRVDSTDDTKLRIDFDSMCGYLLSVENRSFSPRELEKALNKELEKAKGLPVSDKVFDAIAVYIDKKTLWLQKQDVLERYKRQEEIKWVNQVATPEERAERMAEVYRRRAKRVSNQ
jgi:hypothetical protein